MDAEPTHRARLSNEKPLRYPLTANPPGDKTRASNPFTVGFFAEEGKNGSAETAARTFALPPAGPVLRPAAWAECARSLSGAVGSGGPSRAAAGAGACRWAVGRGRRL